MYPFLTWLRVSRVCGVVQIRPPLDPPFEQFIRTPLLAYTTYIDGGKSVFFCSELFEIFAVASLVCHFYDRQFFTTSTHTDFLRNAVCFPGWFLNSLTRILGRCQYTISWQTDPAIAQKNVLYTYLQACQLICHIVYSRKFCTLQRHTHTSMLWNSSVNPRGKT